MHLESRHLRLVPPPPEPAAWSQAEVDQALDELIDALRATQAADAERHRALRALARPAHRRLAAAPAR